MLDLEIIQDIEDNGKLDCLRTSVAPHGVRESDDEYNR
jgi:hypothetical protein